MRSSMAPSTESSVCPCPSLEPGICSAHSAPELGACFAAGVEAAGLEEGFALPMRTCGAAAPLSRNAGAAWAFGGGAEVAAGREVGGWLVPNENGERTWVHLPLLGLAAEKNFPRAPEDALSFSPVATCKFN